MHVSLEGKSGRGNTLEMGVLGGVGNLRPRSVLFALRKGKILANQSAGSYILFTHMIAQRRKVMRGKEIDRRS